jgi:DNA-binding transcriptional ArsR family regulator
MAKRSNSKVRPGVKELRDPRSMRALTHPVRIAILEALALEGPLTATQAGELVDESATTCSFHLRQLEKYGFVEDAGPGGTRQRPWRLTQVGISIPDFTEDAEIDLAANALSKVFLERQVGRMRAWWAQRTGFPKSWRKMLGINEWVWFVTHDELAEMQADLHAVMSRYRDRLEDPSCRPAGAVPIDFVTFTYPLRPLTGD